METRPDDARQPEYVREPVTADASDPSAAPPDSIVARVVQVLHTVYDPEIPVDVYELGLVYGVSADPAGKVKVRMTLTSPTCPAAQSLPAEVEQRVRGIAGVTDFELELTWEPPWNPDMMSDAAKLTLGML